MTKNPFVLGGLGGALSTNNPDDPVGVAMDTGVGALGGKLADAATGVIGNAIAPALRAPVQNLINEGVKLTPGQITGGVLKTTEDSLTHLPVVGNLIKNAQAQSLDSFNRAAVQRALSPIGEMLPSAVKAGHDAVDYAANRLSNAYQSVLPGLTLGTDAPFAAGLRDAAAQMRNLPVATAQQFHNIVKGTVFDRIAEDGTMTGQAMQEADSKLGSLVRSYSKSLDPDQRGLGGALSDVQDELRSMVERQIRRSPRSFPAFGRAGPTLCA